MVPKTLISLNRWLRRNFHGNHPLKSITMNNSFQHSQQEWDKSQAIWGSYSQHNKQSSSPSSSLKGSVLGIHMKGSKTEMQQESKGSTLHDKNSNMHRAGCMEATGRQLCEPVWPMERNRDQGASRHQSPREAGAQLEGDTCGTPGGSSQNSSLFLSTKISSKANQMSSQALPAEYLLKGSSGLRSQTKKLLCSPGATNRWVQRGILTQVGTSHFPTLPNLISIVTCNPRI